MEFLKFLLLYKSTKKTEEKGDYIMNSFLDNFFKLKENNTNVKTEFIAGITTFMTMAYILIVNPSILSAAGMDSGAVFTATDRKSVV